MSIRRVKNGPSNVVDVPSLVDLLQLRAQETPDNLAHRILLDGDDKTLEVSYKDLDSQARRIGVTLQSLGAKGERALLLFPPGPEYIAAFFGALYANATAVPAYPPDPNPARLRRTLPRLQAIVKDSGAKYVLTTKAIKGLAKMLFSIAPELETLTWVATDTIDSELASEWSNPEPATDDLAFLQYTSGSTGSPRGVMLSHGNLLANLASISERFGHHKNSHGVIWLPPYHDMGLIGGILEPIHHGFGVTVMSPIAFLRRPMRWLRAVSKYGGTTSGGPNFAYELCIRKSKPEEIAELDLSSWEVAFSGAEPIRAATLKAFAERFASTGFNPDRFYGCYGLAESTLIVSGGLKSDPPPAVQIDATQLKRGLAVPSVAVDARTFIGCGGAAGGHRIALVETGETTRTPNEVSDGVVGEIWAQGASIAQGYWGRPEESAATFNGVLGDGTAGWLRTGDLGFRMDGELFITGRIKDLIILRGANHYPQDIEATAEAAHPLVKKGCIAAFSYDQNDTEVLGIVTEVTEFEDIDTVAIIEAIRLAVSKNHQVEATAVMLLKPKSIPKTSSGKIQRYQCRNALTDGNLDDVKVALDIRGAHA